MIHGLPLAHQVQLQRVKAFQLPHVSHKIDLLALPEQLYDPGQLRKVHPFRGLFQILHRMPAQLPAHLAVGHAVVTVQRLLGLAQPPLGQKIHHLGLELPERRKAAPPEEPAGRCLGLVALGCQLLLRKRQDIAHVPEHRLRNGIIVVALVPLVAVTHKVLAVALRPGQFEHKKFLPFPSSMFLICFCPHIRRTGFSFTGAAR